MQRILLETKKSSVFQKHVEQLTQLYVTRQQHKAVLRFWHCTGSDQYMTHPLLCSIMRRKDKCVYACTHLQQIHLPILITLFSFKILSEFQNSTFFSFTEWRKKLNCTLSSHLTSQMVDAMFLTLKLLLENNAFKVQFCGIYHNGKSKDHFSAGQNIS